MNIILWEKLSLVSKLYHNIPISIRKQFNYFLIFVQSKRHRIWLNSIIRISIPCYYSIDTLLLLWYALFYNSNEFRKIHMEIESYYPPLILSNMVLLIKETAQLPLFPHLSPSSPLHSSVKCTRPMGLGGKEWKIAECKPPQGSMKTHFT